MQFSGDNNHTLEFGNSSAKHSDSLYSLANNNDFVKFDPQNHLTHQLVGRSKKVLRRPVYPIRPSGLKPNSAALLTTGPQNTGATIDQTSLLHIFSFLSPADLARCALVCHAWSNVSINPALWKRINISGKKVTSACLKNIIRKQPKGLILDWTSVSKKQISWLLVRLPQMRELSLQGCNLKAAIALKTCTCPPLTSLDLSFVTGLNDTYICDFLRPPPDSRPGLIERSSPLRHLHTLKLAGCDLSDASLCYIVHILCHLAHLDLSFCLRLTDEGVAVLGKHPAPTITKLVSVNFAGCCRLTEASLEHLNHCNSLERIDLRDISQISPEAIEKFVASRKKIKTNVLFLS